MWRDISAFWTWFEKWQSSSKHFRVIDQSLQFLLGFVLWRFYFDLNFSFASRYTVCFGNPDFICLNVDVLSLLVFGLRPLDLKINKFVKWVVKCLVENLFYYWFVFWEWRDFCLKFHVQANGKGVSLKFIRLASDMQGLRALVEVTILNFQVVILRFAIFKFWYISRWFFWFFKLFHAIIDTFFFTLSDEF